MLTIALRLIQNLNVNAKLNSNTLPKCVTI